MKKLFILLLISTVTFSLSVAKADYVRQQTLGSPSLLLEDISVVDTYPAALQMFPSQVWIYVDQIPNNYLGGAYIVNDMLGLSTVYGTSSDIFSISVPGGYWSLIGIASAITNSKHIKIIYGMKTSNLYGGLFIQNSFVTKGIVNQTIDSNNKVISEESFGGFQTTIRPSVIMDIGSLKLYANLNATLNFNSYTKFNSYESNRVDVSPNFLKTLGIQGTVVYDLTKDVQVGATGLFSINNNGYSVDSVTNTVAEYMGTNYNQSGISWGIILGSRIIASEDVTLFFDLPFYVESLDAGHWESDDYYINTTYTIPVLNAAAEVDLGSGFTFRASGQPTWQRIVSKPNKYSGANPSRTVTDSYSINSSLGAGFKTGPLEINVDINAPVFNTGVQSPFSLLGGMFTGAAQQFFTQVQLNYIFGPTK